MNSTLKTELAELQKQVNQFHMKYSHCRERNDDLKREQATLTNLIDNCDKMFDELNKKGWDAYKECYKELPKEFKDYTQMDLVHRIRSF